MKSIYKIVMFKMIFPMYYRMMCFFRKTKDHSALFIETYSQSMSDNFVLMNQALLQKGYKTDIFFANEFESSFVKRTKQYFQCLNLLSKTQYVFLNDGYILLNTLRLKKGQHIIQLWHGSGAFKKFSYSLLDAEYGVGNDLSKFPIHRNYSLVTVSSPYVVQFYKEAMHMDKDVVALGTSRTDYYHNEANKAASLEMFKDILPQDKKVILYAPTFRGRLNQHQEYPLDLEKLKAALGDTYIILLKLHPLIKSHNLMVDNEFSFDVSDTFSFESLYFVADACITDYSSVVFDWSLSLKPIAFYAYDRASYLKERGFFTPYDTFVPGPILETNEQIIDWANNLSNSFDATELSEFKHRYMEACDGQATERIVSYIESHLQ